MAIDENRAVARKALEQVWGKGDLAAGAIYAPSFVSHQHSHPDSGDTRGLAALKQFVTEFRAAFPDFTDTVDNQVAEGDQVVTRFLSTGAQDRPLMGIAPTHEHVSWMGITVDRIEDGKIVENWVSGDMAGMLAQLGAIPATI